MDIIDLLRRELNRESTRSDTGLILAIKEIESLRALLQNAEPVAYMYVNEDGECEQIDYTGKFNDAYDEEFTQLFTHPPKDSTERYKAALEEIASFTQDTNLLWWQVKARKALNGEASKDSIVKRDAERYQWLRKNGCKFPDYPTGAMTSVLDEEELDIAVDFNIKESS